MSTESATPAALPGPRRVVSPEVVLGILAVLTFALIPIRINTIYSGLPAHPLFLHVPVILIPVAAIGALVVVVRTRWLDPHGLWLGLIAVIALGSVNLTMGAGDALRADLGLGGGAGGFGGGAADLIARHAHAASILRILTIVFTAVFLVTVALYRVRGGHSTGVGVVDRGLGAVAATEPAVLVLRLATGLLALGCLYFVYHTGDLGAKAVWQGRLGHGFGGGGAGVPGLFSPGG
jgi:preprotein translocase subunit SecG